MKLFIEADNGELTELREIDSIPQSCDVLLFFSNRCMLSNAQKDEMEKAMTDKIGKKCVLIDGNIEKVVGI